MTTLQIISLCLSLVSLVVAAANIVIIRKAEKELDKAIKAQIEIWKWKTGRD
jgi:hypothetical protein